MACYVGGNLHWTHSGTVRRLGAQPDLMLAIHHAFLHDIDPDYDASCVHCTCFSTIAMHAPVGRMSHLPIFRSDQMTRRNRTHIAPCFGLLRRIIRRIIRSASSECKLGPHWSDRSCGLCANDPTPVTMARLGRQIVCKLLKIVSATDYPDVWP